MSVTIYPTQPGTSRPFPRTRTSAPCAACRGGYCQPGWCEDGIEIIEEPGAPECNFANENARDLLAALGLGTDLYGAIDSMEVAALIRECKRALAAGADAMLLRAPMLRANESRPGLLVKGTTDARARERIEALLGVCEWAQQHGAGLAWS